ncbi:MAG: hypothetical protein HXS48_25295 [Theionarchaea archaeon]|nr:hypothetical protein [Theionarchaea archaeon]
MPKRNKSSRHTSEKDTDKRARFVCPVYGKSVSRPHLLDVQSVIIEGWYFVQRTRIVIPKVVFEHESIHCHDEEEDIGLEELHTVIAVIFAEFDGKGDCTVFDILEIRSCDTEDSMKEKSMEVEDG